MAVFNPAATGAAGQDALYVLSNSTSEQAALYVFDIDPATGALSEAGTVAVPNIRLGSFLAYSGTSIVVKGPITPETPGGTGFQLDVTCGLPCSVGGSVLAPGVKAASTGKPAALPFKSIQLPGSGKAVLVTLRFTKAQKRHIAAWLSTHRKVAAEITVTEAAGAGKRSRSIHIT